MSVGITPAYAGKSITKFSAAIAGLDHPRICGEKYIEYLLDSLIEGSPPHMRGKD